MGFVHGEQTALGNGSKGNRPRREARARQVSTRGMTNGLTELTVSLS